MISTKRAELCLTELLPRIFCDVHISYIEGKDALKINDLTVSLGKQILKSMAWPGVTIHKTEECCYNLYQSTNLIGQFFSEKELVVSVVRHLAEQFIGDMWLSYEKQKTI